jgi:hypothetical protein
MIDQIIVCRSAAATAEALLATDRSLLTAAGNPPCNAKGPR